jgi:hypothetical protein
VCGWPAEGTDGDNEDISQKNEISDAFYQWIKLKGENLVYLIFAHDFQYRKNIGLWYIV